MAGRRSLWRVGLRLAGAAVWNGRWLGARLRRLEPGVTIVIANFNGDGFIQVAHSAIRRFSPANVHVLVVDNASSDPSADWLRGQRDIDTVFVARNIGHGPALDLGFHRVRTTHVIALDADAFPISDRWMPALLEPLEDPSAFVVGAETWRPYAHPCALAMRTKDFIDERCSFQVGTYAGHMRDVGEMISVKHPSGVRLIPATETRGPGFVGSVFGGVVYHNFYGMRFQVEETELLDGVTRDDVRTVWESAISKYLRDHAGD